MSYRIAILGGGPAGMSAALWLKNLGCTPLIFESAEACGGSARHNLIVNPWVLGYQNISCEALVQQYIEHIAALDISRYMQHQLRYICRKDSGFDLMFETPNKREVHFYIESILLAMGTRARDFTELTTVLPNDNFLKARVMIGLQAFQTDTPLAGQTVLIVGGGDNAHENADWVIQQGGKAIIVARSTRRVQHLLENKISQHQSVGACAVYCPASLDQVSLEGEHQLVAHVTYRHQKQLHRVHRIHLLIGYQPNTDDLSTVMECALWNSLTCDSQDYLVVDALGRTTCTGIYAAGDICQAQHPCMVSALSSGAAAARAIEHDVHHQATRLAQQRKEG